MSTFTSALFLPVFRLRSCFTSLLLRDGSNADDELSASSLGMMSEEEKKMQRIEDIKELLS